MSGDHDRVEAPVDPELIPGARNAVRTCLAVQRGERVALITDRATRDVASSLMLALTEVEAVVSAVVLEDVATRPLRHMPRKALDLVARSAVAIACLQPQQNEIGSRRELVDLVESHGVRYAHMVWINAEIMRQGMRADYHAVDALSERVLAYLRPAREVVVRSPAGTDLRARFDPTLRWVKTSGLISRDTWSNLPAGEVFTTPVCVDGVFVVDGAVGDYLCPKYGDLAQTPLTLRIVESRLCGARCENQALLADFEAYCRAEPNGDRVGEFALGTNLGVERMIGNLLQDEKVPGVHIAFGNPYGSQTGATWTCRSHIDAITRRCDVWADGVLIMSAGRYVV